MLAAGAAVQAPRTRSAGIGLEAGDSGHAAKPATVHREIDALDGRICSWADELDGIVRLDRDVASRGDLEEADRYLCEERESSSGYGYRSYGDGILDTSERIVKVTSRIYRWNGWPLPPSNRDYVIGRRSHAASRLTINQRKGKDDAVHLVANDVAMQDLIRQRFHFVAQVEDDGVRICAPVGERRRSSSRSDRRTVNAGVLRQRRNSDSRKAASNLG